jgi:hypothetical protein
LQGKTILDSFKNSSKTLKGNNMCKFIFILVLPALMNYIEMNLIVGISICFAGFSVGDDLCLYAALRAERKLSEESVRN